MRFSFLISLFIANQLDGGDGESLTPLSKSPTKFGGEGSAFKPYVGSLDGSSVQYR